jgi:ABC-type multidrug transport system fused ATPase/permease subunit
LIQSEFKDWTVLIVTHHLELVIDPEAGINQVVVLQGGQVVEVGSPVDLMHRADGVFRKLVDGEGQ